ncbi:MAG: adenylosuccinate lyase family protein, partial [Rhodobacteraceae bacterium]|nr:adenylosuccinate lyase family protein [Paracoccaceae bacterium]
AATMPRPKAQEAVGALCARARDTGTPLPELARANHHDLAASVFAPATAMAQAPAEARAFAAAARAL